MAREFNRVDLTAMLRQLSCSDFDGWYAFYQQEIFRDELNKFMLGQVAAEVANASGRYKDRLRPDDFYPLTKPKAVKSVKQQLMIWRSM